MKQWWGTGTPGEITALPWLHPEVTRYLESLLHPEDRVYEHGSGGSTLWLASRVWFVISIESDPAWYERLSRMALTNVLMLRDDPCIPECVVGAYDLMLIDGEPVERRGMFLKAAAGMVKPGGWVVLDNANRPEYEEERFEFICNHAEFYVMFEMNIVGQSKYLVTEFYKMRGGGE